MTLSIPPESEPMLAAVERSRLSRHLDVSAGIRRDTGGPGEDQMVDYIVRMLQADGVPVTVHEFDAFLSYPRSAAVEYLPLSASTSELRRTRSRRRRGRTVAREASRTFRTRT